MMRVAFLVSALAANVDEDKQRPVTKVINLLKKMQETLESENKTDKEVYDKFACWCTTNEKEKTTSIKAAKEAIDQLEANIEEYTATAARLKTEIANLEEEVDRNQKALDTATAIRNKEVAEMNEEEKDLIKSIRALESAIVALSKHHKESMLQENYLADIVDMLKHQLSHHKETIDAALTKAQKSVITGFIQAPGGFKSHASQSGQIFGILRQMKDTFEANLSASQRQELEAQRVYEQLKAAKTAEIKAGQSQIASKNEKYAATRQAKAQAKQDLEDTRASLDADTAFLLDLQTRCTSMDKQWDQRQVSRQEELQAVAEALKILSADDAHDVFTTTFNKKAAAPSFLQVETNHGNNKREQAAELLSKVSRKVNRPRLSNLAIAVRIDAFTKVKGAINDMIAQLNEEKKSEIKHKDWCNEELHQNLMSEEAAQRNAEELEAAIDNLEAERSALKSDIKTLQSEVAEIHLQVQRASETRQAQNKEFRQAVSEQRQTQELLKRAIVVLKDVFHRKEKARFALAQKDEPVGPPPPAGFKTYEKNANSNPVISMLENILQNAANLEAESTRDERDAQEGYESFAKEAQYSTSMKQKAIVNKQEVSATKKMDQEEARSALEKTQDELEALKKAAADVHQSCDYTLKNFDIRQDARDEEIEALRQAKAILSGSGMAGFLQRY